MRSPRRHRRRGRSFGSTTRMIFQRNVESQREPIARSSRIVEWFLQCRGECSLQRKFPFPAVHSNHVRPSTPSPLIAPPSFLPLTTSPCLPPSASQTQRVHCLPRSTVPRRGGRLHFHHKLTPSRNVTAPLGGVHYLHSRGQTGAWACETCS